MQEASICQEGERMDITSMQKTGDKRDQADAVAGYQEHDQCDSLFNTGH